MTTPVRKLVAETLQPFHRPLKGRNDYGLSLRLFDDAHAVGVEALVGAGVGLDLFSGERILAAAQLLEQPKGQEHRVSLAITDRRTALSGWSTIVGPAARDRIRFSVEHAELVAAESKKAGFVSSAHIALTSARGIHKIELAELQSQLAQFFTRLVQSVPPEHRREPLSPLLTPTEADPTGLQSAPSSLWFDDPQARQMLIQIESASQAGMRQDTAQDLLGRILLAHRSIAAAPCMREGLWLSPLTAQDFGHTLVRIFGAPVQHVQPQPGADQLTFPLDPQRDVLGAAVTVLGVASYVALGVGFDPSAALVNAAFGRRSVTSLSVGFQEQSGSTAYRLMAPNGALEQVDGRLAVRCHAALIAAAYPVIARRVAHGWTPPFSELFELPDPLGV